MSLVIPALGYAPTDGHRCCSLPRLARRLEHP